jgi:GrpB-like predicted nucleotidyltransferase (UPF0157 family)
MEHEPRKTLDAQRVYALIERAAERQLATAEVARRILAAAPGIAEDLRDLIRQVAANVANPIADAVAEATQGMRNS